MQKYNNDTGKSKISSFELGTDSITVWYTGKERTYTYSNAKAGVNHISYMKLLAKRGKGLDRYIRKYAKHSYD